MMLSDEHLLDARWHQRYTRALVSFYPTTIKQDHVSGVIKNIRALINGDYLVSVAYEASGKVPSISSNGPYCDKGNAIFPLVVGSYELRGDYFVISIPIEGADSGEVEARVVQDKIVGAIRLFYGKASVLNVATDYIIDLNLRERSVSSKVIENPVGADLVVSLGLLAKTLIANRKSVENDIDIGVIISTISDAWYEANHVTKFTKLWFAIEVVASSNDRKTYYDQAPTPAVAQKWNSYYKIFRNSVVHLGKNIYLSRLDEIILSGFLMWFACGKVMKHEFGQFLTFAMSKEAEYTESSYVRE